MQFIKKSNRHKAKVSLIFLDWSVRESFHVLHYLSQQTVARDDFEVIFIEYYSRISEDLKKFADQIDSWIVLNMPANCYYHKHLMYNIGIAVAQGQIIMIGDSDAMVKPTLIATIINEFKKDPNQILHLDQFRNIRRDFYPFNYPTFDEVIGRGCINYWNGVTKGIADSKDTLHTRNYGSGMCAKREDIIAIGGADEFIDYVGHICGPYDLTFRLRNYGRKEIWHTKEFTYHTWHPGSDGVDNYMGPHDGKNMSTTALRTILTGRVFPLKENKGIKLLREKQEVSQDVLLATLIDPDYLFMLDRQSLTNSVADIYRKHMPQEVKKLHGYAIYSMGGRYYVKETDLYPKDLDAIKSDLTGKQHFRKFKKAYKIAKHLERDRESRVISKFYKQYKKRQLLDIFKREISLRFIQPIRNIKWFKAIANHYKKLVSINSNVANNANAYASLLTLMEKDMQLNSQQINNYILICDKLNEKLLKRTIKIGRLKNIKVLAFENQYELAVKLAEYNVKDNRYLVPAVLYMQDMELFKKYVSPENAIVA